MGVLTLRLSIITAVLAGAAGLAQAESTTVAEELGGVLAAEQRCGLAYDQDAIAAFIGERVQVDDMQFPRLLNYQVTVAGLHLDQMSESTKTAYCAQIGRIAEHYGFTP